MIVLTVLGLIGGGVAVASALQSDSEPTKLTDQQAEEKVHDPAYALKQRGLAASEAKPVFTLADGRNVSVLNGESGRCIVLDAGEDRCGDPLEIASGQTVEVLDECGSSEHNRMEITGLAPADAKEVRLIYSDGSTKKGEVEDGAFRFEEANPTDGGPYPTSLGWVGGAAEQGDVAKLPVRGDGFCIKP